MQNCNKNINYDKNADWSFSKNTNRMKKYSNTGVHTKRFDEKYVIVAENNRYRLTFDERGCLVGIMIQEGGREPQQPFYSGNEHGGGSCAVFK